MNEGEKNQFNRIIISLETLTLRKSLFFSNEKLQDKNFSQISINQCIDWHRYSSLGNSII